MNQTLREATDKTRRETENVDNQSTVHRKIKNEPNCQPTVLPARDQLTSSLPSRDVTPLEPQPERNEKDG
jgi:hypothetical protein